MKKGRCIWKGGFRIIVRIMSKIYRYQTVINRIKKAGLKVLKESSTVRIDELHMYITRSEEHEFGRRQIGKRFELRPEKPQF